VFVARRMEAVQDWYNQSVRTFKDLWADKYRLMLQFLNLATVVLSALMIWKALIVYTGSESPVVVVLSGSMEPTFYRGDILFLAMPDKPVRVGEIVVYNIKGRDIPIVHRVIEVHEPHEDNEEDDDVRMLTKGDNNRVDDRGLYNRGQLWLRQHEIMGRAQAWVPYVGMFTILLNDYPALKFVILGMMGIMIIANREE
jgi:signal peptidase